MDEDATIGTVAAPPEPGPRQAGGIAGEPDGVLTGTDEERLTALFRGSYGDLVRFVRARCRTGSVDDVVAETYLTAWRRLDAVPTDLCAARAWLFTTARHLLLNDARREGRRSHLPLALDLVDAPNSDLDVGVSTRIDMASAVRSLSAADQEVLGLAVVDQLSPAEAGVVLGIDPATYAARLSRARKRLRAALGQKR